MINRDINGPINNDILQELAKEEDKYKFVFRYGTEFFIYNSFLIVNFMLIVLLIYQVWGYSTLEIIAIPVFFGIYICFFNWIRNKRLRKAENAFLKISWILKL